MTTAANGNHRGRVVTLAMPARPEYVTLGRLALMGIAGARPELLPAEALADLKLALTEAYTNTVRHAFAGGEGVVEIVYELHEDRLVVEISDSGCSFASSAGGGPDAVEEADEERGFGMAIIHALADEVELGERSGGGARLRFAKRLGAG